MLLRKINAVLGLLSTLLLLGHAIFLAVWMLSMGAIPMGAKPMAWVLLGLMAAHAFISILLAFLGHKGAEKRKCKQYSRLNVPTVVQRASGILLILLTGQHVAWAMRVWTLSRAVYAVLPPLFFALSLAHVAVSFSKAFITLGIGNATFIKVTDVLMKMLCAAVLIADVAGFYLYLYG